MIYYPQIVAPTLRHLRAFDAASPVREALDALLRGATQDAVDRLSVPIGSGSDDPRAPALLGLIAYGSNRGALATRLLESALALDPADACVRALLAACYLGVERYAEAIEAFREALRRDPGQHAAHALLWAAVQGAGKLDAALRALKRALLDVVPGTAGRSLPRCRIEGTTLCVVDCSNHELAERALHLSMASCEFAEVKFLSDRATTLPGVRSETIAPLRSAAEYSRFVLKELVHYIDTGHVLLVQWDGYIVNPAAWSPEFLKVDYAGARWDHAHGRRAPRHDVGNGGFSLRSRKLLEALQDPAIPPDHPEDQVIGRRHRSYLEEQHGIAYATAEVADRFSFEHIEPAVLPFGFHGIVNLARFVNVPGFATMDYYFDPDRQMG